MTPQPLFPEPQQLLDWEIDNSPWPMPRVCSVMGMVTQ